ncbi:MAG: hypothetical protein L0216_11180 [Planctomycetales bacterium]|nr:hypothetical protein [Planctomycetales bacterium]
MALTKLTPHRISATVQTTNATQTTVLSYTIPDETTFLARAIVLAMRQSSTSCAGYRREVWGKRQSAGAPTIGAIVGDTWEDVASWDATYTISGNDLRVSVTGAAGSTIDWLATLELYLYTPI